MSATPTAKADGTVLTGVSETALLTLQVRANEARRPDSIIDDPMAIQLVDSIDFDWAKFGLSRRQDMAVRALAFDKQARRYLADHPQATVVALAEGLQTSFYRLDAAGVGHEFRWLTVDLPPMIDLRRKLLPASERVEMCAQSALDFSWMDRVATGARGVHHHRGPADVPAARRSPRPDRRMRRALPRGPDDVRPATGLVRQMDQSGNAEAFAALPGAADAVQHVGFGVGKACPTRCRAFVRCTILRCRPVAAKSSTPSCGASSGCRCSIPCGP